MLHAMAYMHEGIRTVVVRCKCFADFVEAVQLVEDVETNDVVVRGTGDAGCGVGEE